MSAFFWINKSVLSFPVLLPGKHFKTIIIDLARDRIHLSSSFLWEETTARERERERERDDFLTGWRRAGNKDDDDDDEKRVELWRRKSHVQSVRKSGGRLTRTTAYPTRRPTRGGIPWRRVAVLIIMVVGVVPVALKSFWTPRTSRVGRTLCAARPVTNNPPGFRPSTPIINSPAQR